MVALNGIAARETRIEDRIRFAETASNILLVGAPSVLGALRAYLLETAKPPDLRDYVRHDHLLTNLIIEIRKDIGLSGAAPTNDFILWSTNPREKRGATGNQVDGGTIDIPSRVRGGEIRDEPMRNTVVVGGNSRDAASRVADARTHAEIGGRSSRATP